MAGTGCDCTPGEQGEHFSSGLGISVLLGASHAFFFGENMVICPFALSLSESLAEFSLYPSPWLLAPQSWSGQESPMTL